MDLQKIFSELQRTGKRTIREYIYSERPDLKSKFTDKEIDIMDDYLSKIPDEIGKIVFNLNPDKK